MNISPPMVRTALAIQTDSAYLCLQAWEEANGPMFKTEKFDLSEHHREHNRRHAPDEEKHKKRSQHVPPDVTHRESSNAQNR